MRKIVVLFIVVIVIITFYYKSEVGLKDLRDYIACEKHGLVVDLHKNDFQIHLQYIPSELTAYRDCQAKLTMQSFDSLVSSYKHCQSFVFTVNAQWNFGNILYYGINSPDELERRQYEVDYHMGDYYYLNVNGEKFYSQLYTAQNLNIGGQSEIKVMLTFVAESKNSSLVKGRDLKLYFNDPFFDTGLTCYSIKNKDIQRIPKLKIL